jgi:hypothetical protein
VTALDDPSGAAAAQAAYEAGAVELGPELINADVELRFVLRTPTIALAELIAYELAVELGARTDVELGATYTVTEREHG